MAFSRTKPAEWKNAKGNNHTPEADRLEAARVAAEEAAEERYEEVYDEVREEGDWLVLLGDYALAHPVRQDVIQSALLDAALRSSSFSGVMDKAIALETEKRVRAEGHPLV